MTDLSAVAEAKRYTELAYRMLESAVVKARKEGATWTQLAVVLGVSYQGARAKWLPVVRKALAQSNGTRAESESEPEQTLT